MRFGSDTHAGEETSQKAFTLMDALVAMMILGGLIVTLYSALTWGFSVIRIARENLRATQILAEKMETVRLYNWDQVTSNGFIPLTFTVPYYPAGSGQSSGVKYFGYMFVTPSWVDTSYENDMRRVYVYIWWQSGKLTRVRLWQTYVSRYGLQNYIY